MINTKESFNYWFRIQFYFRLRFLFELLKYRLGFSLLDQWKKHIKNYQVMGRSYFSWSNFPHRCTDGPDCEIANIYSKSEIKKELQSSGFYIRKMEKTHFPLGGKNPSLERCIAKYIGFYQFVWVNKR
jgi:hypothetical protein